MAIGDPDYWKKQKRLEEARDSPLLSLGAATAAYIFSAKLAVTNAVINPIAVAAVMATRHIGVLVWDRNTDGVIDDGSELFGDNTVLTDGTTAERGFAALAELRVCTEHFSGLKPWL